MDGLEAVEIRKNAVDKADRLDSDFFRKEDLLINKILERKSAKPLGDICKLYDGPFGSELLCDAYTETGIPILRMQNISEKGYLAMNDVQYISVEDALRLSKYQAFPGEVMVTKIGFLGYATVLTPEHPKYIFRRELTKCSIREKKSINPYFLASFFNSRYGRSQFYRYASGTTRDRVLLLNQKEVLVPTLDIAFQNRIQKLCETSYDLLYKWQQYYKDAESALLLELDIKEWESPQKSTAVKSLSSSLLATGRIDAEFYQPKYEEIVKKITSYSNKYGSIGDVCNIYDKNYVPDNNQLYRYIELANIEPSGDISDVTSSYGIELPTRARRLVTTGNVIVSSIEGSLSSCALITDEYNDSLCSTGFYVVDSQYINSETLLILFKSEPMQALLKKHCSGTILTAINKEEFLSIPIPLIRSEVQQCIKESIGKVYSTRYKSQKLLEIAKLSIEKAIEEDESSSLKWIETELQQLGMDIVL